MIIVMERTATEEQVDRVIEMLIQNGLDVHRSTGEEFIILGAIGQGHVLDPEEIESLQGVRQVAVISRPYRRVERHICPEGSRVKIGSAVLGGSEVVLIPSLAAIPGPDLADEAACFAVSAGIPVLRMPFRSGVPPAYESVEWMVQVARRHELATLLDIADPHAWAFLAPLGDAFLVHYPAWNAKDFLLEIAETGKTVLLQIPFAGPPEQAFIAADTLLQAGLKDIAFAVTSGMDKAPVSSVDPDYLLRIKRQTYLPIILDFSNSGQTCHTIQRLSQAAIALGIEGILLEVGAVAGCRSFDFTSCGNLSARLKQIAAIVRRP